MATITLTDDEAIAIAVGQNAVWTTPMFTVDTGSKDAMLKAAIRGARSLLVRGLAIVRDGKAIVADELLSLAHGMLNGTGTVVVYATADPALMNAVGACLYFHPCEHDQWVGEFVRQEGVRELGVLSAAQVTGVIQEFCRHTLAEGLTSQQSDAPVSLIVAAAPRVGMPAVAVRQGSMLIGKFVDDPADGIRMAGVGAQDPGSSLSSAIDEVLVAVAGDAR